MRFATREDIEAPIEHVFEAASDFDAFERKALRRGADVRRVDQGPVQVGSAWDVAFKFRGKDRRMRATLGQFEAPNLILIDTVASGIDGVTTIELVPLSRNRTRLAVAVDLTAKSLAARLLLQSLRLAQATLTKRFKTRVAEQAAMIEDRYRSGV